MKIHSFILLAAMSCASFIATDVSATDLMDVYEKALANDPAFKAARSDWLANKEILSVNKADLLPILEAKGTIIRSRTEVENDNPINKLSGRSNTRNYNNSTNYTIQLTQPIFNFGTWANVWGAQAIAKKAKATFMAAEEDLLTRTAKAYFNVLLAKDVLSYTKANKASTGRLFTQAKHKFDVGLIPITDLEDARKNYDIAVSREIGATNDLSNAFEQLNEITGTRYNDLYSVKQNFPLLSPNPTNIERWVKAAEQQNFDLTAARYDAIAARENVKLQNSGHLPTLNAIAKYGYQYDNNPNNDSYFNRNKTATAGMELSVPVFRGGKVIAQAKQAGYQYQTKVSVQEKTHRSVISKTRQAYLGILSNISKIKADIQTIKSAESSLRATKASYTVGTRTMADVLTSETQLYDARQTFAKDKYTYITQLLDLKALTGILDPSDLKEINSWLVQSSVVIDEETPSEETAIPTEKPTKDNKKSAKTTNGRKTTKQKTPTFSSPQATTIAGPGVSSMAGYTQKEVKKTTNNGAVTASTTKANTNGATGTPATTTTVTNASNATNHVITNTTTSTNNTTNAATANPITANLKNDEKIVALDAQKAESAVPDSNVVTGNAATTNTTVLNK